MSKDNNGQESEFLQVKRSDIVAFALAYRTEYFEDHSAEWCLDEIITRGKAEIKRTVKTAKKTAENKASGDILRAYNLSPKEALALLASLQAQAKAKAEAEAAKPKS